MKGRGALTGIGIAVIAVAVARAGHELPVYPSYYPHEIAITALAPDQAGALMTQGKLHAYVGAEPSFGDTAPETIRAIESLGAFVVVRVNRRFDDQAACRIADAAVATVAARARDIVVHPYPVTPFSGDYLHVADLAEAARARLSGGGGRATILASAGVAERLGQPAWAAAPPDPDAAVRLVDAAGLVGAAASATNGWRGPPWLRTGWYQADLLLGAALDDPALARQVEALRARLTTGDVADPVERINVERALVGALAGACRMRVVGYTLKRERYSAEYSTGIENIGYDAIAGLQSPMFLRTVKLKDFPWNGWLALGVAGAPVAAWNPIAGFGDPFGRLLWSALGDPALLPAPDDAGWTLNRIADVRAGP